MTNKFVQRLNPMKPIKLIILCLLCCIQAVGQTQQDCIKHEEAIKMLTAFYEEYIFGTKPFQLDAAKYCTPRFLSKLGEDYEEQLKEDYIFSQEGIGIEWWSFYNFINGYQDGPNDVYEVVKVAHERDNTYRIYFIEWGKESHRLIDLVKRDDSLFIDDVYRKKFERINGEYKIVRCYKAGDSIYL